jgi:hypothetical protein
MSLNSRIKELENKIIELEDKLQDLSKNTEETYKKPITISGGKQGQGNIGSIDISSGLGAIKGGAVIWNETEINAPYGIQPNIPKIGYNKHSHSRFSGGALIKDTIEIVEYVWGSIINKHSQGFFLPENVPEIATEVDSSNGKTIEKIGLLDLIFNPSTQTWGCPAYEIDIKKCYLVERDENGIISLDSKGNEKKSYLYNEDQTKTAIVWDENAGVWRFYAVYAPGEP